MPKPPAPFSPLILDELFAAADERFLDHLLRFHEPKKLAAVAERWGRDTRPWARRTIVQYLERPLGSLGHETVVKRLFKHAEAVKDDELMAYFACAFDRLVRRKRRTRYRYDWQSRSGRQEEQLVAPTDRVYMFTYTPQFGPSAGKPQSWPVTPKGGVLFSYKTRHHLRRRAWRYFRRMGHQRPADFPRAVARMLALYADASLASGEALLDSRSLMHACFRGAGDVLDFTPAHVNLHPGRSLAELRAAPTHEALWRRPQSAAVLLELCATAASRPVRAWAVQLFRRTHFEPPAALKPAELLPLLDHADDLVQQLGADLLERAVGLETLSVDDWLRLLQTRNLAALETIARVMRRHVTPDRISLEQAVQLTTAEPVPIARLGLELVKGKPVATPDDRATVARLADARAAGVAGEVASWALEVLGADDAYEVDHVVRFFDALLLPTRDAAWAWLTASAPASEMSQAPVSPKPVSEPPGEDPDPPLGSGSSRSTAQTPASGRATVPRTAPTSNAATTPRPRAYDDPALWSRLIETPYDDVRVRLVAALKSRATLPGVPVDRIGPAVWAPVLLNVHRGGRAKLTALRQTADAIGRDPKHAEPLLPVLAVAVRSVRLPEARHGLAALVRAVDAHPPLADAVKHHFPELELGDPAEVCG